MHDFSTPNADEMYYNELARKVRFHKQDEKGVQMASQIIEEYGDERAAEALQKGIAQGIQQGIQQQAIEAAIKLLKNKKLSPEEIADAQGLSLEQVLELQKTVAVNA